MRADDLRSPGDTGPDELHLPADAHTPASLAGLVLCGGESRRMGRDKGLLEKEGLPWARYMGAKLNTWRLPVYYSINRKQQTTYSAILPPERLITDSLGLPGPLEGLLSMHERFPHTDILLLACDMLDLDETTIGKIIGLYRATPLSDFFVYRSEGFLQPFCAIYTARGLAGVYQLAKKGGLDDFSLQKLLRQGNSYETEILHAAAFANYNSL